MQFNYLGGQSQRDTLSQALGQKNPVLDAQLDFNKSAFTTGVAGAGQTMRQAMSNDQQQRDSVLRSKTAREEGQLNRTNATETLERKLSFDAGQAATAAETRKAEIAAAIAQRKIEADEAAGVRAAEEKAKADRRKQDLDDQREKDAKEYDRRTGDAATKAAAAAKGKFTTALLGFNQELDLADDDHRFDDWEDEDVDIKSPSGEVVGQRKRKFSKTRRAMEKHRDDLLNTVNSTIDPTERASLIDSIVGQGRLTYGNVRGVLDGKWKTAQDTKKKPVENPNTNLVDYLNLRPPPKP